MKVTIKENGGLAPGMRQPGQTIDTSSLPEEKAKELSRLVEAANEAGTSNEEIAKQGRDSISYTIKVEDVAEPIELKQSDTTMTQPVADLIEWIKKNAH